MHRILEKRLQTRYGWNAGVYCQVQNGYCQVQKVCSLYAESFVKGFLMVLSVYDAVYIFHLRNNDNVVCIY